MTPANEPRGAPSKARQRGSFCETRVGRRRGGRGREVAALHHALRPAEEVGTPQRRGVHKEGPTRGARPSPEEGRASDQERQETPNKGSAVFRDAETGLGYGRAQRGLAEVNPNCRRCGGRRPGSREPLYRPFALSRERSQRSQAKGVGQGHSVHGVTFYHLLTETMRTALVPQCSPFLSVFFFFFCFLALATLHQRFSTISFGSITCVVVVKGVLFVSSPWHPHPTDHLPLNILPKSVDKISPWTASDSRGRCYLQFYSVSPILSKFGYAAPLFPPHRFSRSDFPHRENDLLVVFRFYPPQNIFFCFKLTFQIVSHACHILCLCL